MCKNNRASRGSNWMEEVLSRSDGSGGWSLTMNQVLPKEGPKLKFLLLHAQASLTSQIGRLQAKPRRFKADGCFIISTQ